MLVLLKFINMPDIQVKIEGVDALIKAFGDKQEKAKEGVAMGIHQAAVLFRDTAMQYARAGHPVGPNVISGLLSAMEVNFTDRGLESEAQVKSPAPYSVYVEYGHMQVMAWGHAMEPKPVQPYPFMRPAVLDVFDSGNAQKLIENAIKEVLS
jgi:hypothetical protein